jgi:hypothetical protein
MVPGSIQRRYWNYSGDADRRTTIQLRSKLELFEASALLALSLMTHSMQIGLSGSVDPRAIVRVVAPVTQS